MPELEIVGEAGDGQEALVEVSKRKPDVILLDVNMPRMNGIEAVQALQSYEDIRIIMLTISRHDEDLFGAIRAGADGYLLKNAEPEELRQAITHIFEGRSVLSPEVTGRVLKAVSGMQGVMPEVGLSRREMDVLACLAQGKTSAQIAADLFITENTVKTHVRHILEKLEASNRAEAVSRALHFGIIKQ
jgi:DNA-binding NarL/FixJ family response regulator